MPGHRQSEACPVIESDPNGDSYLFCYNEFRIPFRIQYRDRKRLAISVHPDQRLEIVAPEGAETAAILRRIDRRKSWILKQIRYFENFKPKRPLPVYESGESFIYLGRQYRLKVREGEQESVKLIGRFLELTVSDKTDMIRKLGLVEGWYRKHAARIFVDRVSHWLQKSPSLRTTDIPSIYVRKMPTRWGSCTKAGNISLNPELIKAPIQCVDYVIVHELCHRIVHDHSPAFYRLLGRCLPDWEKRKARLEGCFE
jgi:predicted metal-dependent hydrolase